MSQKAREVHGARRAAFCLSLCGALLGAPVLSIPSTGGFTPTLTSHEARLECVRRARVWEPVDVASRDLYNGPSGKLPFAVDEKLTCDFVPKPLSGRTDKFLCRLADGSVVKVKYLDNGRYKEVFGEVLGTRLFWALGFYCDRMLPVRVTCRGCPRHPWEFVDSHKKPHLDPNGYIESLPPEAEVATYTFDTATIEERLDGRTIEERPDEGWSWKDLDGVVESKGGATRAERDALKLLNAFVQNADNKAKQNALVCPSDAVRHDEDGAFECLRPIMYVDDLGSVFGKGGFVTSKNGRVDYAGWSQRPVWRDAATCRARLAAIGGPWRASTLKDPVVSEEGRALLSKQLGSLSDAQIADLFRAARIDRVHQKVSDGAGEREVTIEDWVELFKKKRDEITNHPGCPPAS